MKSTIWLIFMITMFPKDLFYKHKQSQILVNPQFETYKTKPYKYASINPHSNMDDLLQKLRRSTSNALKISKNTMESK